ncbi:DUF3221 domain-containing protein [Paenibacillus periandrae]|uniref:DUF3221 domain-containing protein n=1 Tax=Paenibacillus periandrae TaxID=1761741 RepID=UPI001F09F26E|nr:DUF3221 domain-containing protein [Paenibacillus periandrae]
MLIASLTTCTLYATEAQSSESWNEQPGVISASQLVHVNETGRWLDEKWLPSQSTEVKENYYPVHMEVTFMNVEEMYDLPEDGGRNGGKLSPQTVTAIGQLFICKEGVTEGAKEASLDRCRAWYRILTYLGEKWIAPTKAIEHYESKQALGAFTPSFTAYQNKFNSSIRELEPLFARFSVEIVSLYIENGIARLEIRKLYQHREKLNDEEVEALKNAIFKSVGGSFPLSITTFTLSDKTDRAGKIMSIDKLNKRVLVVYYDKRIGMEHSIPGAYWFGLAADSNIHRKGYEFQMNLDDLRVDQTVEVWPARASLMSYPGQTTAYEISIVEDAKPGEEGILLSTILGLDLTRIDKIELEFKEGKHNIVLQEPDILQAITERMQYIRLQIADQYPGYDTYTMTLYQADKKFIYSGNLVLLLLPYRPTSLTIDLDTFIQKLK